MVNNAKAFNKLTEKYYETYGKNPEYKYFLEELTDIVRKGKILDLGCGTGVPVARYLLDRGYDITAVDFSKKMIENAKKNLPEAEVIYEDILKLDLEPNTFDGAVIFFTFNFLQKKEMIESFNKINASIKEEGGIIISVIEGDFEGEENLLGEKVYLRHIAEDEIRDMLKDYKIHMVERRDYSVEGEKPQTQMFLIAKKKSWHEINQIEEDQKDEETPQDAISDQLNKLISIGNQKTEEQSSKRKKNEDDREGKASGESLAQIRYDDVEEDDEEPAIRITFFKKKK